MFWLHPLLLPPQRCSTRFLHHADTWITLDALNVFSQLAACEGHVVDRRKVSSSALDKYRAPTKKLIILTLPHCVPPRSLSWHRGVKKPPHLYLSLWETTAAASHHAPSRSHLRHVKKIPVCFVFLLLLEVCTSHWQVSVFESERRTVFIGMSAQLYFSFKGVPGSLRRLFSQATDETNTF